MSTEPFPLDETMKQTLDDFAVPELSADFADRVVAGTRGRASAVPPLRPTRKLRWHRTRRVIVGAVTAGAIASAAAATGVLDELGIEVPTADEVWSAITFEEKSQASASGSGAVETLTPSSEGPTRIEGPIDTPEELEEVFRRVDDKRNIRREDRRDRVDQRIDGAIERRGAKGLPTPTPQQEQRLREGIERFRDRADTRREERTQERRDALRNTLEEEGKVSRDEIIRRETPGGPGADRLRRFREMTPEERRDRIRQFRERRSGGGVAPLSQEPIEEVQPQSDPAEAETQDDPPSPDPKI